MATLEDNTEECSIMRTISFSEWLDEFLCRLFSLLLHLEPTSVLWVKAFRNQLFLFSFIFFSLPPQHTHSLSFNSECYIHNVIDHLEFGSIHGGAAGMKAFIHQQHQELFWLRMALITFACWKSCLEDFQSHCLIRLYLTLILGSAVEAV